MKYQATQVYLDPEDHARLKAEAQRRGISLAALMRALVSGHAAESVPDYDAKSWDALIVDAKGRRTDIRREADSYQAEAMDALYEKKMRMLRKATTRQRKA